MNSTDILQVLRNVEQQRGYNADVDINNLAASLDMPINKLVSALTELENRDEISLSISYDNNGQGDASYKGSVKLLESPPDDKLPE